MLKKKIFFLIVNKFLNSYILQLKICNQSNNSFEDTTKFPWRWRNKGRNM